MCGKGANEFIFCHVLGQAILLFNSLRIQNNISFHFRDINIKHF